MFYKKLNHCDYKKYLKPIWHGGGGGGAIRPTANYNCCTLATAWDKCLKFFYFS